MLLEYDDNLLLYLHVIGLKFCNKFLRYLSLTLWADIIKNYDCNLLPFHSNYQCNVALLQRMLVLPRNGGKIPG